MNIMILRSQKQVHGLSFQSFLIPGRSLNHTSWPGVRNASAVNHGVRRFLKMWHSFGRKLH